MTDEEALELAKSGRSEGFRAIYLKYSSYLYTLAIRVLRRSGAAEDAVQEAFMSAFRSIQQFRGDSRLKTWLYTILMRAAMRILNKGQQERTFEKIDLGSCPSIVHQVENEVDVRNALDQMEPKDRALLVMAYWDDLSCREISEVLEIKENHAKVLLFRARQKFAKVWNSLPTERRESV